MNPIPNPNQVFSHDAVKFVYQESDMRTVNPSNLNIKPFKVNPPEKSKKTKKDLNKKKLDSEDKKGQNKDEDMDGDDGPDTGVFDLFKHH